MAGFSTDEDRKVIPRWRTFDETLRLGELNSAVSPRACQQVTSDFLSSKIMAWREHRTVSHAADLVGAALTLGREKEAAEAARFLLQDDLNVSPWARELSERALKTPESTVPSPKELEEEILHERVRTLRHLLRAEPRDPITWVELSLTYAILGLGKQAARSMTVALQLAMNNRFVLRSASRLWIYLEDPEKAHDLIARADRTIHDPWLLAAEVAIGSVAGRKPRFIKAARRMFTDKRFSPIHISELASAVATLELDSGSVKKSRRPVRPLSKMSKPKTVLLKLLGHRGGIAQLFALTTSIWTSPMHSRHVPGPSTIRVNGNGRLRNSGYGSSTSRFQVGQVSMAHTCPRLHWRIIRQVNGLRSADSWQTQLILHS